MRDRWNALDAQAREKYEILARQDQARFQSESHKADVAAIERRERLQKERATLLLDDVGGTQRGTRGQRAEKERKEQELRDKEILRQQRIKAEEQRRREEKSERERRLKVRGGGRWVRGRCR